MHGSGSDKVDARRRGRDLETAVLVRRLQDRMKGFSNLGPVSEFIGAKRIRGSFRVATEWKVSWTNPDTR